MYSSEGMTNELPAEEMLLTVAATISEEEMGSMISNNELSQLIKEPVLSKAPKCVAEGCWYGIISNEDKTVGLCPKCLGTGVAALNCISTDTNTKTRD